MENKAKDYIVNIQCIKDSSEEITKGASIEPAKVKIEFKG
jgi:hypothetical protein